MSKSLGNVVNPDDILEEYGADVFRLYEMFLGPFEASCPWNTRDIPGPNRFLHRAWRLFEREGAGTDAPDALERLRHKVIKKVSSDIETMGFNTAIAQLMSYVNELTKEHQKHGACNVADLETLAMLLAPFAPHFSEEVWHEMGHEGSVFSETWPEHDEALAADDMVILVVQVNGKKRGTCEVPSGVDKEDALAAAREVAGKHVEGKQVIKEIFVARANLVNLVVRG